ncbi:multiple epidermal growth factor-like domains protein 6 [Trichogramma pretiosum]|uniref:EGF-like domain-containing protein n=1 Tax=Trichogramma kaykai TaxID=54128 RepID=A0ABD2WC77_9HYME|nr:multiple epidermal growth factor-like domains protein 6 [Trichogramma pretiosum]
MRGPILLLLLVVTVLQIEACEVEKMGNGCRITSGQCACGYGCKSEYRYATLEECKLALNGRRRNACHSQTRCLHGGTCLQITANPEYKCLCEGTGYFGYRCEKACPGRDNPNYKGPFPLECVVI